MSPNLTNNRNLNKIIFNSFFPSVYHTTQNIPSTHLCFPSKRLQDIDPVFLSPN